MAIELTGRDLDSLCAALLNIKSASGFIAPMSNAVLETSDCHPRPTKKQRLEGSEGVLIDEITNMDVEDDRKYTRAANHVFGQGPLPILEVKRSLLFPLVLVHVCKPLSLLKFYSLVSYQHLVAKVKSDIQLTEEVSINDFSFTMELKGVSVLEGLRDMVQSKRVTLPLTPLFGYVNVLHTCVRFQIRTKIF